MSNDHAPRVLFFGMQSYFSPPVLSALIEADLQPVAIVEPASSLASPTAPPIRRKVLHSMPQRTLVMAHAVTSLEELAKVPAIPIWEVQRLADPTVVAQLAAYQPDVICVACFSLRIPRAILALPRLGCLNLHPSLLPANRGPVPLFWTFHAGEAATGVTVHLMDEGMDSGAILAQAPIEVPDGISYAHLEVQCATVGGALMASSVWDVARGLVTPIPQEETLSSYHTFPGEEAFIVHAEAWEARHLYNFICGIGHWDRSVELHVQGGQRLYVRDAIACWDASGAADAPDHRSGEVRVPCKDGWVLVRPL